MTTETKRLISYAEARECLGRLINSHFNNPGEHARVSIPADPERDDDILLCSFIDQQRDLLRRAREELRLIRMKDHPAVYDTTLRIELDLALETGAATKAKEA